MALIIPSFANGGLTFQNAYLKVDNIIYDNTTKLASYDIIVYNEKGGSEIKRFQKFSCRIKPGLDLVSQIYASIISTITNAAETVDFLQPIVEQTIDEQKKIQLERKLASAKKVEFLLFNGAVSDEVVN